MEICARKTVVVMAHCKLSVYDARAFFESAGLELAQSKRTTENEPCVGQQSSKAV